MTHYAKLPEVGDTFEDYKVTYSDIHTGFNAVVDPTTFEVAYESNEILIVELKKCPPPTSN